MLGTALKKALGDKAGVRRFASGLFPLDEALVQVAVDLSGRPFLVYEVDPISEWIGTFDPQLAEEFWRGFAFARRHHAAPAVAVREERAPRDRGVASRASPAACATRCGSRARSSLRRRARSVDLFPAIDLRDGNVVRLLRGDFAAETVYDGGPGRGRAPVRGGRDARGSTWSTSTRRAPVRPRTSDTIAAIVGAVDCQVQVGGGVRDVDAAARADRRRGRAGGRRHRRGRASGAGRRAQRRASRTGSRSGSTPRASEVAVRGWVEGSGVDVVELATALRRSPVPRRSIVTEIRTRRHARGTGSERCTNVLLASVDLPVVASGGVGTLDDLAVARRARGRTAGGWSGAIVGRALYEQRFTVAEAVAALRP